MFECHPTHCNGGVHLSPLHAIDFFQICNWNEFFWSISNPATEVIWVTYVDIPENQLVASDMGLQRDGHQKVVID